MNLNEVKPINQASFVVEVIENGERNMYILRSPNGTIIKVCFFADEVATFLGELEFSIVPTSKFL